MSKGFYDLKIKVSRFIAWAEWIISHIYGQNISLATERFFDFTNLFEDLASSLPDNDLTEQLFYSFHHVMECLKDKDYLLVADYLEIGIKKALINYMEAECMKYNIYIDYETQEKCMPYIVCDEKERSKVNRRMPSLEELERIGYKVENTSIGIITVARTVQNQRFYIHSNYLPYEAARQLVKEWIKEEKSKYIILGAGLCYHITQLLMDAPTARIEVYESDLHMLQLAAGCAWKGWAFMQNNATFIYDPGYRKFIAACADKKEDTEICFYYPSIMVIEDKILREKMLDFFIESDNINRWKGVLFQNFKYNTSHIFNKVDELCETWKGRNVFYVAGGPSLNKNINKLREIKDRDIILTAGTSFRRLLHEGIRPDYVIITDPKPAILVQIEGFENNRTPLLMLTTTYQEVTKKYKGDKYLIYQRGYKNAEDLAKKENALLVDTGGSVSTTALDICIQFGCKKVIFLGLDLAFTGGMAHHSQEKKSFSGDYEYYVEDVFGDKIGTSRNLNMYRQWIEKRIAKEKNSDIEFIDASEGGAKIRGTRIMTMDEVLGKTYNY